MIDKRGHQRAGRRVAAERVPHPERGLFDSAPRFVMIVALLAAVTTGPSVALAVVGWSCLGRASAPATTPFLADGAVAGSVVVPGAGVGRSAEPLPVAQRESPDPAAPPPPQPRTGWLLRAI
jgi:hypothetical protein